MQARQELNFCLEMGHMAKEGNFLRCCLLVMNHVSNRENMATILMVLVFLSGQSIPMARRKYLS